MQSKCCVFTLSTHASLLNTTVSISLACWWHIELYARKHAQSLHLYFFLGPTILKMFHKVHMAQLNKTLSKNVKCSIIQEGRYSFNALQQVKLAVKL